MHIILLSMMPPDSVGGDHPYETVKVTGASLLGRAREDSGGKMSPLLCLAVTAGLIVSTCTCALPQLSSIEGSNALSGHGGDVTV